MPDEDPEQQPDQEPEQQPAPPASRPAEQAPALPDFDRFASAVGRGVAAGLRELGINSAAGSQPTPPKPAEKPEEEASGDGGAGDAGGKPEQSKRPHWLFGD
ncbi:MAG TPA: hypothetical protein VJ741_09685 [Solirubrobacteraceae bacterium]|nr:hypothetical protein [Solirubrobacteraceae bacterium]